MSTLRERLPRNAPWLVSLALAALITVELARAALSLAHSPTSASPEPQRPSLALRPQNRVDVKKIASAHLFGVSVVDPGGQDPKPTAANLLLAGTIATGDANRGLAIISIDDLRSELYSVGQNVGGALLHAVYRDHVLLDRNGALETLALPQLLHAKAPASQARPRQEPAVVAQSPPVSDAPRALSDLVRLAPSSSLGIRGFRVLGGKDLAAFRTSGLRPNDVVTAINGIPLQDQQTAQRSFDDLQSGHAVVTVMRGVHPVNINLDIGQ